MPRRSQKEIITQIVYDSLPDKSAYQNLDLEKISFKWFVTGRTGTGLRLTDEGFKSFSDAGLIYYDFPVKHTLKGLFVNPNQFAFIMNKHIKCPYYLGVDKTDSKPRVFIRLYDSKIAMMVSLYGNIEEYLNAQNNR